MTVPRAVDTSRRLVGWLAKMFGTPGTERDLVAELIADYRAEAEHAAHLREHAERARYSQAAEAMRALADREDAHAEALRDLILSLGGGVPPIAPEPLPGRNPWERAVAVHEAAQAKRRQLITRINAWDPGQPEVVRVLRAIEREDAAALSAYDDLVMKADPHSVD